MNRTIKLFWNGTLVLEGRATTVTAYETMRAFLEGTFAGLDHMSWCAGAFVGLLDRILDGEAVTLTYADDTGNAGAEVTRA